MMIHYYPEKQILFGVKDLYYKPARLLLLVFVLCPNFEYLSFKHIYINGISNLKVNAILNIGVETVTIITVLLLNIYWVPGHKQLNTLLQS